MEGAGGVVVVGSEICKNEATRLPVGPDFFLDRNGALPRSCVGRWDFLNLFADWSAEDMRYTFAGCADATRLDQHAVRVALAESSLRQAR
jgi:hypothetical protein